MQGAFRGAMNVEDAAEFFRQIQTRGMISTSGQVISAAKTVLREKIPARKTAHASSTFTAAISGLVLLDAKRAF